MWRPSKEWFEWAKQLPIDDSPIGRQITREEALELFKHAKEAEEEQNKRAEYDTKL